eukprot:6598481-Lingulodinium_polyedra.AAC.1
MAPHFGARHATPCNSAPAMQRGLDGARPFGHTIPDVCKVYSRTRAWGTGLPVLFSSRLHPRRAIGTGYD